MATPRQEPNRDFTHAVETAAQEGASRHARWDEGLFRRLAEGPARLLWANLGPAPLAAATLTAYLGLLREAIGCGYVRFGDCPPAPGTADPVPARQPSSFLALCLLDLVPRQLPRLGANERIALLGKVWNLGEGLLREPAWVDRYVVGTAAQLKDLNDLEGFLVRTLEPALTTASPSHWRGPFAVSFLDTRPLDNEFLPGAMHLAAPSVLCVHDRRHEGVHLGVFLRRAGQSRFMGLAPCLGTYHEPAEVPRYVVEEKRLRLAGATVELPLLRRHQTSVLSRVGLAVVSAVDSQKLWIVESAA